MARSGFVATGNHLWIRSLVGAGRLYAEGMDTPVLPTEAVPSSTGRITIAVLWVVVLAAIAVLAWWRMGQKPAPEAPSPAADLNSSLKAITATTSASVPTTANPLKSATPAVNPIQKTNPFNNAYQNPFK